MYLFVVVGTHTWTELSLHVRSLILVVSRCRILSTVPVVSFYIIAVQLLLCSRVIIGGLIAATARAIIESPLELAKVCYNTMFHSVIVQWFGFKVRRQTGQTWSLKGLYQVSCTCVH